MLYRWKPFFSGVKTAVSLPFGACQSDTERVTVTPFSVKLVVGGRAAPVAAAARGSAVSLSDGSPQAVSADRQSRATTVGAVRVRLVRGEAFMWVSVPLVSGDGDRFSGLRGGPVRDPLTRRG